jgi:hypothetical protein
VTGPLVSVTTKAEPGVYVVSVPLPVVVVVVVVDEVVCATAKAAEAQTAAMDRISVFILYLG